MEKESEKEKLEFLKRVEIRTMEKDIKRLREIEAEKERERIAALKKEVKEAEVKPEVEALPEETLIPKPKRRIPGTFQKILIRLAIFLLLIFLISFFYWLFGIRKPPKALPPEIPPPKEEVPPIEIPPEKEEIFIPPSLISVKETKTIEFEEKAEILKSFSQVLEEELPVGSFTRILLKNLKENKILGLKGFFEVLEIKVPEEIYQKLENDFTLFIYSQEEGKRIGFITTIKESEGLEDLLKSWEPTMEKDFENFFEITGKAGKPLMPYFKSATYLKVPFRYQTFTPPHFGICYSIFNQYFIFTSSGKSIMKLIDQLTKI